MTTNQEFGSPRSPLPFSRICMAKNRDNDLVHPSRRDPTPASDPHPDFDSEIDRGGLEVSLYASRKATPVLQREGGRRCRPDGLKHLEKPKYG